MKRITMNIAKFASEPSSGEPKSEVWYMWKVFATVEDSNEPPRLLTPWANPFLHEFAFDFLAKDEAEAELLLDNHNARAAAEQEGWVLVKVTYEPIRRVAPVQGRKGENEFNRILKGETVDIGLFKVWEDFIYERKKTESGQPQFKRVLSLVYFDEDEVDSPSIHDFDGTYESFIGILGTHSHEWDE